MLTVIHIGTFSISTYWIMLLIGAIGMGAYVWNCRNLYEINKVQSIVFTVVLTAVGFFGAKLLFVMENLSTVLEEGISLGGVSFFGSVFVIPLVMPLASRLIGIHPKDAMDLCGPCVAIMICCMRFGCFFQGCCGGWKMCVGELCFLWPTQAIESLFDFAIFLRLFAWRNREEKKDALYPLFMLMYSLMRFCVEFLRDTPKDWLGLSHGQWFALGATVTGIGWLAVLRLNNIHSKNT